MRVNSVAPALRERLGHDATVGLLELVELERSERDDRMLSIAAERFDRRLAQELADLRVTLVREIHETRSESIKWSFIFWVTQVSAFATFVMFLYRSTGR
jgi:hypothetical protein